jgi:hypothetical protein
MIQKVYTRKLRRGNIFIIWKVYTHTSRSEEEMIMIQKVHLHTRSGQEHI